MTTSLTINGLLPGFFYQKSAIEIQQAIKNGQYTATQIIEKTLADIERLNPILNAFVAIDKALVLKQAYELDQKQQQGLPLGPLHGVPVAVKDLIFTRGLPTTAGSAFSLGDEQKRDAECIMKLREAGAIIIGKTLTHEFAFGPTGDRSFQGASCNPWDITRMTGGSSAGSACAVAAGLVPLAVGTDTGGSIRIPSALCGTVGFKPSYNSISTEGVYPLAKSLDHVGPIANNVADAALLYQVLRGANSQANDLQKAKSQIKFAWLDPTVLGAIDSDILDKSYHWATNIFKNMTKATIMEIVLASVATCYPVIQRAEAYATHYRRVFCKPELFDKEVLERLQRSAEVKGWEYISSKESLVQLNTEAQDCFKSFDLLVMPTVGITAPLLQAREAIINSKLDYVRDTVLRLTSPFNLLGFPAISIPIGFHNNLPTGLQVIANYNNDDFLLETLMEYLVE